MSLNAVAIIRASAVLVSTGTCRDQSPAAMSFAASASVRSGRVSRRVAIRLPASATASVAMPTDSSQRCIRSSAC